MLVWSVFVSFTFLFFSPTGGETVNNGKGEMHQKEMLLKVEELPGTFRQVYKTWDQLEPDAKVALLDRFFTHEKYWGYFFSTWGKYYFYTENKRVLRILKEAIFLAAEEFEEEGVILTKVEKSHGHWYRETFARNIRLLLDAYTYTKEPLILKVIEEQTQLWLSKNKRVSNSGFEIFPYSAKLSNSRSSEINVNQNLQMGLVFSRLYFLPEGKYYLNEQIKKIALDEVNAGLSLVRSDGFIPLNQHAAHVGDSNYAGLSTSILYELVQMWGDKNWMNQLKKSGQWLEKSFKEDRPWNAKTDGKDYHFEQFSAYNLFSRIPAFYAAGISSERAKEWMDFVSKKFDQFDVLDLVPRWDHLQSLPENYYSDKVRKKPYKVIPPAIYAFVSDQTLNINLVGSEIDYIKVGTKEFYDIKGKQTFQIRFKDSEIVCVRDSLGQESELSIPKSWTGKKVSVQVQVFDYNHSLKDK